MTFILTLPETVQQHLFNLLLNELFASLLRVIMLQTYLILHLLLLFLAYNNLSCHAFSAGCSPTGASIRRNNKIYPSHHIILHSSTRTADETDQFNVDKVPSTTTTANEKRRPSQRRISQTEKFARLPVWPVSIFTYLFQCIH